MKIIFMILITLSLVRADEMDRIEAIVDDITQLRQEYEACQKSNTILKAEVDFKGDLNKSNHNLDKKIRKLEKQLLIKNNLLKSKDKTIEKLKLNQKYPVRCEKNNTFPKLIMKKEQVVKFKASSFELKVDSIIYDGINGKKVDNWVETTSFTSSVKTKSWIKITGYFVDKKWRPAKSEMWVKIKQVVKK